MNKFVKAIANQETVTTNGMKARVSTANANVDLFYKIGASRGKNVVPDFTAAFVENRDYALRIAQWARDIRQGAGERELFRSILKSLVNTNPDEAKLLVRKVPELGRWDDVLVLVGSPLETDAFQMIKNALDKGDGLCAKWMPRKGPEAVKLREFLGWTPKFYRKRLVELTKVVETQMCANDWDNIDFNKVPSVATARYKKAFGRHTEKYGEWATKLVSKDPEVKESVKVNAGAVYPYDVIRNINYNMTADDLNVIRAQWEALPNYMNETKVMPLVDVSGSMGCPVGDGKKTSNLTCMDVAVSLGLYVADKNKGVFKDTFLTFTSTPKLVTLKGDIVAKNNQLRRADWGGSTNIQSAFETILKTAVSNKVPQEDMPDVLLILSDMQFDYCTDFGRSRESAMEMVERKYAAAGYKTPKVVFWNINAYSNVPVAYDKSGAALVSGFSPTILKSVLAADFDNFTPEAIMRKTIMVERYDI